MASCSSCGETILFGGVQQGALRFCNASCQGKWQTITAAARVPEEVAAELARQIHSGQCPRCQGSGPVDVHATYWVWSALAFSRWGSKQQVSCRRCAAKTQAGNLAFSAVLGWWGFPWGLILTPVQVFRNVVAMAAPPNPMEPSQKLVQVARVQLLSQVGSKGQRQSATGG